MKLILVSDTHNYHKKVTIPECDILIHAGDWTSMGRHHEVRDFAKWLEKQPAKAKFIVPGNHESYFEQSYPESLSWVYDNCKCDILIDESISIGGINFFGSPWTPLFGQKWAYNAGRTPVEAATSFKPFIGDIWAKIPNNTNFLITHGQPLGILDSITDWYGKTTHVGDSELLKRIDELKDLKWIVGGHLHPSGGKTFYREDGKIFFNAAICNNNNQPVNKPIVLEI